VGDAKSIESDQYLSGLADGTAEQLSRLHVLDVARQRSWAEAYGFATEALLPTHSYTRKNIGYLYAIAHGAQRIYETDDDNVLLDAFAQSHSFASSWLPAQVDGMHTFDVDKHRAGVALGDGSGARWKGREQKPAPGRIVVNPVCVLCRSEVWAVLSEM
jgi:hypothetical protein